MEKESLWERLEKRVDEKENGNRTLTRENERRDESWREIIDEREKVRWERTNE